MANSVDTDAMVDEIVKALKQYGNEIGEQADEISFELAKKGLKRLKKESPKLTGDYRKGWRLKKQKGRKGRIRQLMLYTLHNATDYQLTHLLEKEHATSDGTGRVQPKVHIKPIEEDMEREFLIKLEQAVSGR